MNRPLRRLLALVATVLVATVVTVSAYLHGRAEVERLSRSAGEPALAPILGDEEALPLPSIQVRAEVASPGAGQAG